MLDLPQIKPDILEIILNKLDDETIEKIIKFNDININKIIFSHHKKRSYYYNIYEVTANEYINNNDKHDEIFYCCNCNNEYNNNYFRRRLLARRKDIKMKRKDLKKNTFKNDSDIINSCSKYRMFDICGACSYLFLDDLGYCLAFEYIYYKNYFYNIKKDHVKKF
jgi:hypothetical protein